MERAQSATTVALTYADRVTTADLDREVRLHIYRRFVDGGQPPTAKGTARALGLSDDEAADAFRRLAEGHVIVLQPGTLDIWMANPLSAVPTPFRAEVGGRSWYGNCAWDAPGIVAMLGGDGRVDTACPDCEEPLEMTIRDGRLEPVEAVGHFAVPARKWWEDIGFT